MKLYRYMSLGELGKFLHKNTLKNTIDHSKLRGSASTARGFCFGVGDEQQAKKDFRRLRGIVCLQALLVFTPKDIGKFTSCKGRYIDYDRIAADGKDVFDYPMGKEPNKFFDEYCAESYSVDDVEHIEYIETDPQRPMYNPNARVTPILECISRFERISAQVLCKRTVQGTTRQQSENKSKMTNQKQ